MEREGLLAPNTDTQMAGPRAYGYCSQLPGPTRGAGEAEGPVGLGGIAGDHQPFPGDVQGVLPSPHGRALSLFGLVYYGCCEPVHDRLALIMEAIPNLRSVSVSGWSDLARVAEMRDLDTVNHDRSRIAEWVQMTRSVFRL